MPSEENIREPHPEAVAQGLVEAPVTKEPESAAAPQNHVTLHRLIGKRAKKGGGWERVGQPVDKIRFHGQFVGVVARREDAPVLFQVAGISDTDRAEIVAGVTALRAALDNGEGKRKGKWKPSQKVHPCLPDPEEVERIFDEREGTDEDGEEEEMVDLDEDTDLKDL